ncbi:MAG: hypothetical protein K2Z81_26100, partial [Cyanobacteria bacterium]|nr:hypothetical protein [Cyanobacteriota bacterium]
SSAEDSWPPLLDARTTPNRAGSQEDNVQNHLSTSNLLATVHSDCRVELVFSITNLSTLHVMSGLSLLATSSEAELSIVCETSQFSIDTVLKPRSTRSIFTSLSITPRLTSPASFDILLEYSVSAFSDHTQTTGPGRLVKIARFEVTPALVLASFGGPPASLTVQSLFPASPTTSINLDTSTSVFYQQNHLALGDIQESLAQLRLDVPPLVASVSADIFRLTVTDPSPDRRRIFLDVVRNHLQTRLAITTQLPDPLEIANRCRAIADALEEAALCTNPERAAAIQLDLSASIPSVLHLIG